jgi:hypothetical protein
LTQHDRGDGDENEHPPRPQDLPPETWGVLKQLEEKGGRDESIAVRIEEMGLDEDLLQFTGSVEFYRHWAGFLTYTEGVKYLADRAKAYWLIDDIASYQTEAKVRQIPFQVWNLDVQQDKQALLTMQEEEGQPPLVTQDIPFTDFPIQSIQLFLYDKVLMLPGEY